MTTLTPEQLQALTRPFDPGLVQFKPGATNRDKTKALALAYVDSRAYFDRLDEVAGADWSDEYTVSGDGTIVTCRLTICGTTRTDVGEKDTADQNTTTSAAAQAFKRACAKFGLGRYLYRLPQEWADYDRERRRFTDQALIGLQNRMRFATVGQENASGRARTLPEQPSGHNSTETTRNQAQRAPETAPDAEFDALPGHERSSYVLEFKNPDEAKQWGMSQGVFKNQRHCDNAYDKLRRQVIASSNGSYPTASEFFAKWVADVQRRKAEAADAPQF